MKKYSLTTNKKEFDNALLYQIKAERDIPRHGVKKGDLGGWITFENILKQEGDCWIGEDSYAYGFSIIEDNLLIEGKSIISLQSHLSGDGVISHSVIKGSQVTAFPNILTVKNSTITDSDIWCNATIEDSRLSNILARHLVKSLKCYDSDLLFKTELKLIAGDFLFKSVILHGNNGDFAEDVTMEQVRMILGYEFSLSGGCQLKHVKSLESSNVYLHQSVLIGDSKRSILLDKGIFQFSKTQVYGQVFMKGILNMRESEFRDAVQIISDENLTFKLEKIKMGEMAILHHSNLDVVHQKIENKEIFGDMYVEV